jgi:hypothetical protein
VRACLGVWLLFKVFFILKCVKMIFFYFLKTIFKISTSKRFKIKKNLIIFFLKFFKNTGWLTFPNTFIIVVVMNIISCSVKKIFTLLHEVKTFFSVRLKHFLLFHDIGICLFKLILFRSVYFTLKNRGKYFHEIIFLKKNITL